MTRIRTPLAARHLPHLALTVTLAASSALSAQNTTSPPPANNPTPRPYIPYVNRNLIMLDAAHGGDDDGDHIDDHTLEKDVTLALASRIRTLLVTDNLTVLSTRETDATSSPLDPLTPAQSSDARAGLANHAHPLACILLHATGAGTGVHVFTSSLEPLDPADLTPIRPIPWDSAQATFVPQSTRLAASIATSLTRTGLPVHLEHASVRPIDSLLCPAVAIEIAPLPSGSTEVSSPVYQGRVAQAVATAILFWHNQADSNPNSAPASPNRSTPTPSTSIPTLRKSPTKPVPRPIPRPASPATTSPATPAPIIRRPPASASQTGAQP